MRARCNDTRITILLILFFPRPILKFNYFPTSLEPFPLITCYQRYPQYQYSTITVEHIPINKKIKFSSFIRKVKMELLESHICLTASSPHTVYGEIFAYFLIYNLATAAL